MTVIKIFDSAGRGFNMMSEDDSVIQVEIVSTQSIGGGYYIREARVSGSDIHDTSYFLLYFNSDNQLTIEKIEHQLNGKTTVSISGASVLWSDYYISLGGGINLFLFGNDQITGNSFDDAIIGSSGNDTLYGGAGNDRLSGRDGNDLIFGGDGNDQIYGFEGDDQLHGNRGNDTLQGLNGNDLLLGHDGDDTLSGGEGDDELQGNQGNDLLFGETGNDLLFGHDGDDTLWGGEGDDELQGNQGNDLLFGEMGNDLLLGHEGDDYLWGGEGDDELQGNQGNDHLIGETGNDRLFGQDGDDLLYGKAGDDVLYGGGSNDFIDGGDGNDTAGYYGVQGGYTLIIIQDFMGIKDRNGSEGIDSLINIEKLTFADRTLDLDNYSSLTQLNDTQFSDLAKVYVAYFNRAADAEGLYYWADKLAEGMDMATIASYFSQSAEAKALYPDTADTSAFVTAVYANVLGRKPEQAGFDFWTTKLNSGELPPAAFVLSVIGGAQGADITYLSNKADLGVYFSAIKGMSDVTDAQNVLNIFGDQATSNTAGAKASVDGHYSDATASGGGEFIFMLVGIVNDPFAVG